MGFGSQAAANWFDNFFWWLQVASAAQMLDDGPYFPRIDLIYSGRKLALTMHPHSTVQQIEWSFVYHFAICMRNWVLNGYTGTGAIMFTHKSGIKLVAFFFNTQGRLGSVAY